MTKEDCKCDQPLIAVDYAPHAFDMAKCPVCGKMWYNVPTERLAQ